MANTAVQPLDTTGLSAHQFYGHFRRHLTAQQQPVHFGYDEPDNNTRELEQIYRSKGIYTMSDTFHRESERLKTFEHWPHTWLDKCQLAQTGMFFTGEDDKVKCFFCGVEIGRWEREDEPVPEHMRWSPNCPLLRRRTTNNEPINAEALDQLLPPVSYDVCGANESIEVHRNAYPEGTTAPASRMVNSIAINTVAQPQLRDCNQPAACSSISNGPTYFPEYPEYAIEAARLRSFCEWPRHMAQKPEQLAEAGFFYTGVGDRVRCFSCGGGLKDWDVSDEPWEQHALWMSKCRFLKLMKGQNYIDGIIAKQRAQEAGLNAATENEQNEKSTAVAASETAAPTKMAGVEQQHTGMNNTTATTNNSNNPHCDVPPAAVAAKSNAAILSDSICARNLLASTIAEKKTHTHIPEEKLCKICYANEYNTAFLPCGHVVACAKCASSVTKCPLCRKPFTDVMRVYFS